jgi:hypothetical protein
LIPGKRVEGRLGDELEDLERAPGSLLSVCGLGAKPLAAPLEPGRRCCG